MVAALTWLEGGLFPLNISVVLLHDCVVFSLLILHFSINHRTQLLSGFSTNGDIPNPNQDLSGVHNRFLPAWTQLESL